MWKLMTQPKTMLATLEVAIEYRDMDPAPQDRPLSSRRIEVYESLMRRGAFRPVTWAKAHCKETGGVYRVNGKHTSTMLANMEEIPEFYITVEEYACDTLSDVAELYATFDSKMVSRTTGDINLAFAGTVPGLVGIPARILNTCVAGLSYACFLARGTGQYIREQPADRAERILEYPEFIRWVYDLGTNSSRWLLRVPTVSAMLGTWNRDRGRADTFWTAVRSETGETPSLPDRKLAKYLQSVECMKTNSMGQSGYREIYVKCLHAWNAWRKGETTALRYYEDIEIPKIK